MHATRVFVSWLCPSILGEEHTAPCNLSHTPHPCLLALSRSLCSGFRHDAHPMAIMVGVVGALAAFYPEVAEVR